MTDVDVYVQRALESEPMTAPNTPETTRRTVLSVIHFYWQGHGYAPRHADVGKLAGVSKATAFFYIGKLKDEGYVDYVPHRAGTLRVTDKGRELLAR